MKILYINSDLGIPVLGRKGAAVHVRAMVSAFTNCGHDTVLVAPSLTKSPWEEPAEIAGTVLHIPANDEVKNAAMSIKEFSQSVGGVAGSLPGEVRRVLYNEQLNRRLLRKFTKSPPDFIYERVSLYGTSGVHLAKAVGCPLILELNAPLAQEQSTYRGTGLGDLAADSERWLLSQADAVLAVSKPLAEYVESVGVDPDRIHVIPNGVDCDRFVPKANSSIGTGSADGNGAVLGFVGGLRPWHGVEVLPELMARLTPDYPDVSMLIVGDGPLRKDLDREFALRNLQDKVTITGLLNHTEIPAAIRTMDIALAPYPKLDHSFYFSPLKLFEYMACGVPVVASSLGQIIELVDNNKTGLLYEAENVDALESACRKLLSNEDQRAEMGSRGAELVRREYTWKKNAERATALAGSLQRDSKEIVAC